ncbi:NXPE family member 4 [Patella vulgata]|uniref:NXPE family member 4 n=1 Tax=Patella vulgata TaxID=6465 RepID=UPI00217F6E6A|nr:NXPE family member 4 [Patella vulgata]
MKPSQHCVDRDPIFPDMTFVCNITYENGDDLWFCGSPPSKNLSCADLMSIHDDSLIDIGITPGEKFLAKRRGWMSVFKEITVEVKGKAIPDNRNLLPTCNKLPKSKTWDISSPTGYALNGEYHPSYCRITQTRDDIKRCLKDTTLFFTGDSTTRQWFTYLTSYLNCALTSEKWYTKKWQRYAQCKNKQMNMTIHLHPHNLPFSLVERRPDQTRMRINAIGMVLDKVPSKGKTIFVIYLYGHLTRHHYYISREKFRNLIPGLRRALARNKDLYVVIKSPHWFVQDWIIAVNDYPALFIKQIIMEEFKDFRQQIVYLDFWDMSSAYANTNMHPPNPMLSNMIRLLFGYACP